MFSDVRADWTQQQCLNLEGRGDSEVQGGREGGREWEEGGRKERREGGRVGGGEWKGM